MILNNVAHSVDTEINLRCIDNHKYTEKNTFSEKKKKEKNIFLSRKIVIYLSSFSL